MCDEICQNWVSGALDRCKQILSVGGPRKSWFWTNNPKKYKTKNDGSVLRGSAGVENSVCGVGFLTSFRPRERRWPPRRDPSRNRYSQNGFRCQESWRTKLRRNELPEEESGLPSTARTGFVMIESD